MIELLLPSQWVFVYIVSFIVIMILALILAIKDEQEWMVAGVGLGLLLPLLLAAFLLALGNFISFMIWLWAGAPEVTS